MRVDAQANHPAACEGGVDTGVARDRARYCGQAVVPEASRAEAAACPPPSALEAGGQALCHAVALGGVVALSIALSGCLHVLALFFEAVGLCVAD